jgi:hypothetical protein
MVTMKPKLIKAVERYFSGRGHPDINLFNEMISPETRERDRLDAGYRARRFVKVLSGISLLPGNGATFIVCSQSCCSWVIIDGDSLKINAQEKIPQNVAWQGQYDVCEFFAQHFHIVSR